MILKKIFLAIAFGAMISAKSKIAIVSLYDKNYRNIGQYSDPNKTAYAKKHGYDLFLYHDTLDTSRPPAWSKVKALQKHLSDYDWLFWTDADSLIMNHDIKLESLIDNNFDFIIARQALCQTLNTGSFLIRNSKWSHNLLKSMYEQTQYINHNWWDQAAFIHLYKRGNSNFKSRIKTVHQRVLNSHVLEQGGVYQEGDFVIHFYYWPNISKKEDLMKFWSEKSKQLNGYAG